MFCNVLNKNILKHLWERSKTQRTLCNGFPMKRDPLIETKNGRCKGSSIFPKSHRRQVNSSSSSAMYYNNDKKVITNVNKQYKEKVKNKISESLPRLIDDSDLGLQFFRLHMNDPILNNLMTIVRTRKRRENVPSIVIEGHRHIRDALRCQLHIESLIFSKKNEVKKISSEIARIQSTNKNMHVYKVPQHDLKLWSTLTTPPGVMAIFKRPGLIPSAATDASFPITVICDNIREPNNLGSIIRSCAALPCQQVIVTHGCCDPWESKALRGGCGGQFVIPIYDDIKWKEIPELLKYNNKSLSIYIAENNIQKLNEHKQQAVDYANLTRVGMHNVVIVGGESHGVSNDAYNFLNNMEKEYGSCLFIPVSNGVDSLNVVPALTLIIYELRKIIIRK